jgi:hypothetical protein
MALNWDTDVRPVLLAVYEAIEESLSLGSGSAAEGERVNSLLGRAPQAADSGPAFEFLHNAGYIRAQFSLADPVPNLVEITEKGLQQVAGWPS